MDDIKNRKSRMAESQFVEFLNDEYQESAGNILILKDLKSEAMESTEAIREATRQMQLKQGLKKNRESLASLKSQIKQTVHEMKRIAYNLGAELDYYVEEFVRMDGVKLIMFLIEEAQDSDD